MYRRALAIFERSLGAKHPKVITCLKNHAALLHAMKRPGDGTSPLAPPGKRHRCTHSPPLGTMKTDYCTYPPAIASDVEAADQRDGERQYGSSARLRSVATSFFAKPNTRCSD